MRKCCSVSTSPLVHQAGMLAVYGQIRLSLGSQCWRHLPVSIVRVYSITYDKRTEIWGQNNYMIRLVAISARVKRHPEDT